MNDGALLGRQLTQSVRQCPAESLFVRVGRRRKKLRRVRRELEVGPFPCSAPTDQVNGQVVRQTEKEGALVPHVVQQVRLPRQFDEQFLHQVFGVGFVPRKVQQEREQRLG